MATGRSDYPNQVNNVLGFPFIFRGALDVRAAHDSPEDAGRRGARARRARASAGAEEMLAAYNLTQLAFGRDYIIPSHSTASARDGTAGRGACRDRGGCGAHTLPGALSGLSHPAVRWRTAARPAGMGAARSGLHTF